MTAKLKRSEEMEIGWYIRVSRQDEFYVVPSSEVRKRGKKGVFSLPEGERDEWEYRNIKHGERKDIE